MSQAARGLPWRPRLPPPWLLGTAAAIIFVFAILVGWRSNRDSKPERAATLPRIVGAAASGPTSGPASDLGRQARSPEAVVPRILSSAEKAARVEKIKRDYDEIRLLALAKYGEAGEAFPGGSHTLLRQLALVEREKRADLAAVLTPRELEDLEMKETAAGRTVDRLLGSTPASEEQRRAVFRLQREFDLYVDENIDASPRGFLECERARQHTQQQIRVALGDALFGVWLAGESEDYARAAAFVASHGLPANVALELRQARNDFMLGALELNSMRGMAGEQLRAAQLALARQAEARAMAIVGPGMFPAARAALLEWLPRN